MTSPCRQSTIGPRPTSVLRRQPARDLPGRARRRHPLRGARVPSGAARTRGAMEHHELIEAVRGLRQRRYSPAEIARALGLSKAEAARLVRMVACERDSASTAAAGSAASDRATGSQTLSWVSPGWRYRLRIEGHR